MHICKTRIQDDSAGPNERFSFVTLVFCNFTLRSAIRSVTPAPTPPCVSIG